jgi:hypothetical protein
MRGKMDLVVIGAGLVFAVVLGLYLFDKKGSPELQSMKSSLTEINASLNTLTGGLNKTAVLAGSNEIRMTEILKRISDLEKEADATEEMCLRLREGQAKLNDRISMKRPIVKVPTGPIQVEIYDNPPRLPQKKGLGKGLGAVLKDAR